MRTFKTADVVEFLKNNDYPNSSIIFAEKFNTERVESNQVADWFKLHLGVVTSLPLFRKMECEVVQHMELDSPSKIKEYPIEKCIIEVQHYRDFDDRMDLSERIDELFKAKQTREEELTKALKALIDCIDETRGKNASDALQNAKGLLGVK